MKKIEFKKKLIGEYWKRGEKIPVYQTICWATPDEIEKWVRARIKKATKNMKSQTVLNEVLSFDYLRNFIEEKDIPDYELSSVITRIRKELLHKKKPASVDVEETDLMQEWELLCKDRGLEHYSWGVGVVGGEVLLRDILDKRLAEHIVIIHNSEGNFK